MESSTALTIISALAVMITPAVAWIFAMNQRRVLKYLEETQTVGGNQVSLMKSQIAMAHEATMEREVRAERARQEKLESIRPARDMLS